MISKTAGAYEEAASFSSACTGAAYHARFLRGLVAQDVFKARQSRAAHPSPVVPSPSTSSFSRGSTTAYHEPGSQHSASSASMSPATSSPPYALPTMAYAPSQETSAIPQGHSHSYSVAMSESADTASFHQQQQQQHPPHMHQQHHPGGYAHPQAGADLRYWDQMFRDIGFSGSVDAATAGGMYPVGTEASTYGAAPGVYAYQYMQSDAVGYPT